MSKKSFENLKPFNRLPKEELSKISSKAGKASGVSRRNKAALRMALDTLLSLEVSNPQIKQELENMGLTPDNQTLLALTTFQNAIKGNQKATELIIKTVSQKDEFDLVEQNEKIKHLKFKNEINQKKLTGSQSQLVVVDKWKDDLYGN
ncbi:stress-induced protein [Streptococcus uberis]|uniref:stress-induced protein n=1 Tax=Streptococcus uberis TaxID=1349 RepID=UPI001FF54F18|nr:stress-induced protein [Streptococcus uberis]MCK1188647.1 stress-induced protein [Streptococcus uberis]